jgi:hypothetical protein
VDPLGLDKQSCGMALPEFPAGASVKANIAETLKHHFWEVSWFINQVDTGKPWDYKQQGKTAPLIGGIHNRYDPTGNFNYGAVAAAFGFSDAVVLRAAGFVQWQWGKGRTWRPEFGNPFQWNPPYGDDFLDQHWIQAGIDYYRCKARVKP